MPFLQLYYHIVWTTKHREPLLTSETEPLIYGFLKSKIIGLGGTLFALGGTTDHVHIVASVPAKLPLSTFVGQVKGVASARFNKSGSGDVPFYWQEEYGAFTFDRKRLPSFVAYVENQRHHHAEDTTIPVLERVTDDGLFLTREESVAYSVEDDAWREAMMQLE